jgi:hypothetical protein
MDERDARVYQRQKELLRKVFDSYLINLEIMKVWVVGLLLLGLSSGRLWNAFEASEQSEKLQAVPTSWFQ